MDDFALINHQNVIDLTKYLTLIAAPSGFEMQKANACKQWLDSHGIEAVIDNALNVVASIGTGDAVMITAHTDTVFGIDTKLEIKEAGDKLYCPGIGDDTADVAVLMYAMLFAKQNEAKLRHKIIFALNSCEEGQGNLKGVKELMQCYGDQIKEFIAIDGYIGTVHDKTVGSMRYRLSIDVDGGHSFRDFGAPNAIELMSKLIVDLASIELPNNGITTYNFGNISGGTTVNTIAAHCEMLYEFRSDNMDNIRYMESKASDMFVHHCAKVECIGVRPCGDGVDEKSQNALLHRADCAFEGISDLNRYPASTDCNIPASMGIPAICIGCVSGGNAHTLNEYIYPNSLKDGLQATINIIKSYME